MELVPGFGRLLQGLAVALTAPTFKSFARCSPAGCLRPGGR
jgi:hypothetical protein